MPSIPSPLYCLVHKDYYEDLSVYRPEERDFYEAVFSELPSGWSIDRQGIWFFCYPFLNVMPDQGWKIHISATPANAREILHRITSVLFKWSDTSFKFAVDMNVLFLINSKNWSRGGSGKFITIYPPDNRHFLEIIEELHNVTRDFCGPYILSDHRYKDSRVIFYRYGGMRLRQKINIRGERVAVLAAPDGTDVPDKRAAYPVTPDWAGAIIPEATEPQQTKASRLNGGRYTIEGVFTFSNAGGVYFGRDHHTNKKVVIKEARPCVNATPDGYDAIELLKKEYRLLTVLSETGIAPQPVELFQEWEHWFLVEEHIEGMLLRSHSAAHNVLLRTRPQAGDYQKWCDAVKAAAVSLANILDVLHRNNIVFADLSPNNLMVTKGGAELKIIDFEGAHQTGIDRPSTLYTPGFTSPQRISGRTAEFHDDYYSAGAVLLAYLFPINGLLHLRPEAKYEFIEAIRENIHLPSSIIQMICQLMSDDESQRPTPNEMYSLIEAGTANEPPAPSEERTQDYGQIVEGIVAHIHSVADYGRKDRLFPADPKLFTTNPVSLAYGAAGVAHALQKITGKSQERTIDWILNFPITTETCPPGLYVGMSGIGWCLLEMGAIQEAEEVLQRTFNHPLLEDAADLFFGLAGWGMANLRFFLATGNELYLDKAKEAGEKLLAKCIREVTGCCWRSADQSSLGLAHGSSGIALFLLYLYLASGDERYVDIGQEALNFDLAAAFSTKDGGTTWAHSKDAPSPVYPYWRYGSAGVGMATLRFSRLPGLSHYGALLEQIFIDTDRKYSVSPGRFMGLAGLGEFMLDMHEVTGEARFLKSAVNVATGVVNFRVERGGIAFPGTALSRLSCDYGTGSAGIGLFLNRLLKGGESQFMLDSLFETRCRAGSGSKNPLPHELVFAV